MKKFLVLLFVLFLSQSAFSKIYTVTNNSGSNIAGSLLACADSSNANFGKDTIEFNIGGGGFQKIMLVAGAIFSDTVYVNGTSQPGYSFTTYIPLIAIDASLLPAMSTTFYVLGGTSQASTFRGLIFNNNYLQDVKGLCLQQPDCIVKNCWFGLDSSGMNASPLYWGLVIPWVNNPTGNTIGGTTIADRNVFGACRDAMIVNTSNNFIGGNYLGLSFNGTVAMPIANNSLFLAVSAHYNQIGTTNAPNFFCSTNTATAIAIDNFCDNNSIKNNYFGVAPTLTDTFANIISIGIAWSKNNIIGGTAPNEKNYFCSSSYCAIYLNFYTDSTVIQGNDFGRTPSGLFAPNNFNIKLSHQSNYNRIGGPNPGEGNYFAATESVNFSIEDSSFYNQVSGNLFGTDPSGSASFGAPTSLGLYLNSYSRYNIIGGPTPAHKNIFANNNGVTVNFAHNNTIQNNFFGTDITGSLPITNNNNINISLYSDSNLVRDNVISGASSEGILISSSAGPHNMIYGNKIGTNASGTAAIPNLVGIVAQNSVLIGSSNPADKNIISGNTYEGINLTSGSRQIIKGNTIGLAADGVTPLPNQKGIMVNADSVTIGGWNANEGNLIAYNTNSAIQTGSVYPSKINARIIGNSMYKNATSSTPGIDIADTSASVFSPNDFNDLDTFSNRGLNHPVIQCASMRLHDWTFDINYTLNCEPNTTYMVEFFSDSINVTYGQGQEFLGRFFVTTDASGNYSSMINVPTPTSTYRKISATVTDTAKYATSEFSLAKNHLWMTLNTFSNNVCSNGTGIAFVNGAQGGAGNYVYDWFPGNPPGDGTSTITVGPGSYYCTVSDGSACVATSHMANIGSFPQINISLSATNATCGNASGSVTANVTGGTGGLNYYWNTGATTVNISSLNAGQYFLQVTDANNCYASDAIVVANSNGPTVITNSVTPVTCNGQNNGAIDITVSGGASPYTFIWSNNTNTEDLTNLIAGNYDVIVKDNSGCEATLSVNVTQPQAFSFSASSIIKPDSCGKTNGSILAGVSGGNGGSSYTWGANTGFQTGLSAINLGAGAYQLNVTDSKGCKDSTIYALQDTGAPVILIDTVINAGCILNGGNGAINTTALGTGPFTYLWTTGAVTDDISSLTIGVYGLTVTDALGCKGSISQNITGERPGEPMICILTVDTATNNNMIVWDDNVPGVAQYEIFRESSVQGSFNQIATLQAGTGNNYIDTVADAFQRSWRYSVRATDSCGRVSIVNLEHKTIHCVVNPNIAQTGFDVSWDAYQGNNVTFTHYRIFRKILFNGAWTLIDSVAANAPLLYTDLNSPSVYDTNFYFVEINSDAPCVTSLRLSPNTPEVFGTVKKSRSNINNNILGATGISEAITSDFTLYPNPAKNEFFIQLGNVKGNIQIEICDLTGRVVERQTTNDKLSTINCTNLTNGVYFISITSAGKKSTKKLVLEK